MAGEVAQSGPSSITVARVIARAGVSRRAFYEIFTDIEDCLLATLEWALALARSCVLLSIERESGWRDSVRAGLAALLRFFDENPLLAQLCIVHAAAGGPRVLERRSAVLEQLTQAVDHGRKGRSLAREPSPIVAEGVVGAVLTVLYTRLLTRQLGPAAAQKDQPARKQPAWGEPALDQPARSEPALDQPARTEPALIDLHGQLMSLIVLPYLGANAAAREMDRPAPAPPIEAALPEAPASARAMLELPQGRLTYRTVRVLRAVAESPGGSNRDIAERAGIVDQGQISKILARLQDQQMVVNRGGSARARGTPNAWWLTDRGERLERALRDTSTEAVAGPPALDRRQLGNGSGSRRRGR